MFNLSNRVLSDAEIRVLEKGLDYAPMNEPELIHDFNDFCRRMRLKWHFRDEPNTFSEIPAFRPKSTWVPPKGHPCLEVFLSQVEAELFKLSGSSIRYCNMSKDEWDAIRSLADDRTIVIKRADKGSCVVIWDRNDYLLEAEKQLKDKKVSRDVEYNVNVLKDLAEASNKMFSGLRKRGFTTEKQLKYFTYEYRKATNFGKLYLLPKIHKRLYNVPGRPVISNCGTPTEKCSEFLDFHLKPVMQNSWSYLKDSGDFLKKMENIDSIPEDTLLVTADVVGLYPSIPHTAGLAALRDALDKREAKKIPTEDLVKMAEFVLKNNYFEFNGSIKQQLSGTAIGTKFAPPYACIFMDKLETNFLKTQTLQPLVWFRYIDDIFFLWTHGEGNLKRFLEELNNYDPNIKFTHEYSKKEIPFLDLKVGIKDGKITTDLYVKDTDRNRYLHYTSAHPCL